MGNLAEFYYGVPVQAFRGVVAEARHARFWFVSRTPGKAWVVLYDRDRVWPVLVAYGSLSISCNPTEPPRMPPWAREKAYVPADWWKTWRPERYQKIKERRRVRQAALQCRGVL